MSTPEKAYSNLVGVTAAGPACGTIGMARVVPGASAQSLLYLKVSGKQPCGKQMPDGLPALSSQAVAQIKSWIDAGAKNDIAAAGSSSGAGSSGSGSGSTSTSGGSSGSSAGSSSGSTSSGGSTSGSGSTSGGSTSGSGSSGSSSGKGGSSGAGWGAFTGEWGTFGQTWDNVNWSTTTLSQQDLLSVACVGNQYGWVAGTHGVVLHTIDGGQTWSTQTSGATSNLNSVRFGKFGFGVAAGDGGTLLVTADGGSHWTTAQTGATSVLRGVAIAGSTVIVVGDGATLLRSTDAGASWSVASVSGAADLHGVAIDSAGHIALAVDTAGKVWRSDDLGAAFALDAALGAALDSVSIADDGTSALTVGAGGAIFVRDSRGTWQSGFSPTTADLHAALIEDPIWYAVGQAGTLMSSHDHGATWSWLASGTTATLHGLDDL
jgi:photosystem II stability/assembly factor-like uncharacterized protein